MVDELQRLSKTYNTKYFTFSDEAVSPHALNDVSEEIIERGLNIRSLALLKFEKVMDHKLFEKVKEAGFIFLMFGLESANDRILSIIDKGTCQAVEKETLRASSDSGIWNHTFLFFGFPTETKSEAFETINFLSSNIDSIHSFGPGVFLLNRDSSVYQFPEKYAIDKIIHEPDLDLAMNLNFEISSGMSRNEAEEMNLECIKMGEQLFQSIKIWGSMPREHFLLYLDHYGKDAFSNGKCPRPGEEKQVMCRA